MKITMLLLLSTISACAHRPLHFDQPLTNAERIQMMGLALQAQRQAGESFMRAQDATIKMNRELDEMIRPQASPFQPIYQPVFIGR